MQLCRLLIRLNSHTDFHSDLVVRDISFHNMTTRIDHFEPLQMVQGFFAFGDRILDGIFDAFWRRSDNFNFWLVSKIRGLVREQGASLTRGTALFQCI